MEGYKHKEIAEMLSISENTSKSQLLKAKKMLRNQWEKVLHY
jgi:RNA polymerase sigma-70 factor (ECF subfamily)